MKEMQAGTIQAYIAAKLSAKGANKKGVRGLRGFGRNLGAYSGQAERQRRKQVGGPAVRWFGRNLGAYSGQAERQRREKVGGPGVRGSGGPGGSSLIRGTLY